MELKIPLTLIFHFILLSCDLIVLCLCLFDLNYLFYLNF